MRGRVLSIAAVTIFVSAWTAILVASPAAISRELVLSNDASEYSAAALHLEHEGFYSLDGVRPFQEREPGYSVFLAAAYAVFGDERTVAVFALHAVLHLCAAWVFCRSFAREAGEDAAALCFLFLLAFPSIFRSIFSVNRESLTLSLMLLSTACAFSLVRSDRAWKAAVIGLLLGAVGLTYYSLFLWPFALGALLLVSRKTSLRSAALIVLIPLCFLAAWSARNAAYDGKWRVIADFRSTIMWYARGEQAQSLRGTENARCLWAEYISRDWSGRSYACSEAGLYHMRWRATNFQPNGHEAEIAAEGKRKILQYFPWYAWQSLFEVLEFHVPFVGGGWSHGYNVAVSVAQFLLYVGCLLALRERRMPRSCWVPLAVIAYAIGIFSLTDAMPRFHMPVIFCYVALAAVGYARLLPRAILPASAISPSPSSSRRTTRSRPSAPSWMRSMPSPSRARSW